jgi:hypothetical protein
MRGFTVNGQTPAQFAQSGTDQQVITTLSDVRARIAAEALSPCGGTEMNCGVIYPFFSPVSTQLALEEAGILTAQGTALTETAVAESVEIPIAGGILKNDAVVSELTKDGSNLSEWGKFRTKTIRLPNGRKVQIHFYKNKVTGAVNYNVDFKVK